MMKAGTGWQRPSFIKPFQKRRCGKLLSIMNWPMKKAALPRALLLLIAVYARTGLNITKRQITGLKKQLVQETAWAFTSLPGTRGAAAE